MLITQALATRGAVGVLLLDIVGAFDEVMRQSITVMAQQGTPDVRDTVNGVLKLYEHLRTYVVTAYGLSEWYKQIDGVLQGGGAGPPTVHHPHAPPAPGSTGSRCRSAATGHSRRGNSRLHGVCG